MLLEKWVAYCTNCSLKFPVCCAGKISYSEYAGATPQTEKVCPNCGAGSHKWEDCGDVKISCKHDALVAA